MKPINVVYVYDHPDLQDCPIGCIRWERTIYINPTLYFALTPFEQKFWYLHEVGHIELNTNDEVEADAYAFDAMAGTEYRSLKQMVAALDNLLTSPHPEARKRKAALMVRATSWDAAMDKKEQRK